MREDLLGLPLDLALACLKAQGIEPEVMVTAAPRRQTETGGMLRVVYCTDDGMQLTAARFLDPIAENRQENI